MASENDVPSDILALIFEYCLSPPNNCAHELCERDTCVVCGRVMSVFLGGAQACRLRGVCSRWRGVFLSHVILRGLRCDPAPWCIYPQNCLTRERERLAEQTLHAHSKRPLHIVPQAALMFPTSESDDEYDTYSSGDESYIEDSESSVEVNAQFLALELE